MSIWSERKLTKEVKGLKVGKIVKMISLMAVCCLFIGSNVNAITTSNSTAIKSASLTNGTITPAKSTATAGSAVSFTVTPASGYKLKSGTLKYTYDYSDSYGNTLSKTVVLADDARSITVPYGVTVTEYVEDSCYEDEVCTDVWVEDTCTEDVYDYEYNCTADDYAWCEDNYYDEDGNYTGYYGNLWEDCLEWICDYDEVKVGTNTYDCSYWDEDCSGGYWYDCSYYDTTTYYTSTITISAEFEVASVTVSFNSNGGTAVSAVTKEVGQTYGTLSTPTKSGYLFGGWYLDQAFTNQVTSSTVISTAGNHTLYAKWALQNFTASFETYTSEKFNDINLKYNEAYGDLPTPTRTGYTFAGWYLDEAFTNRVISTTLAFAGENHTLYAKWMMKTYTISFNSNGGSAVANKIVVYDAFYGTLTTPTRTGYIFAGWYKEETLTNKVDASTIVKTASNHTLYAKWVQAVSIEPSANPVVVKTATSGSGSIELTPGIYLLEATGAPDTEGPGGMASGWLAVTSTTTYYYSVGSAGSFTWINNINGMENYVALVKAGSGIMESTTHNLKEGKTINNASTQQSITITRYVDLISYPIIKDVYFDAINEYSLSNKEFNQSFNYKGSAETLTLKPGTYTLEVWGAQGGYGYSSSYALGGKGGYAVGTLSLTDETNLYIHVGGQGSNYSTTGIVTAGYNGGGNGYASSTTYRAGAGGGATDIRIGQDSLYARVIVAGGGGGGGVYSSSSSYRYAGGVGGGTSGANGSQYSTSYRAGLGGSQTAGGTSYYGSTANSSTYGTLATFGQGGSSNNDGYGMAGGGGGWYGGGYGRRASAGGGSGYVLTSSSAIPSGYLLGSEYYLTNAGTYAGDTSFAAPGGGTETGHAGNGAAKITGTYQEVSHDASITNVSVVAVNILVDENIEHGTLTPSTEYAQPGETVNITVTPDTGYKLTSGSLQILDKDGNVLRVLNDNATSFEFPTNVSGEIIEIPSNAKIALGEAHSAYIDNNGDLYMFGYNYYGQLGDGTTTNRTTPVKIASNVKDVSLGTIHSAYIDNNGDLYMFGHNGYAQLGDGTTTTRTTPVKIASNVKDVSLGAAHSAYIDNNGDLYMFGYNNRGQLGDGTTTYKSTPVKIASNVKDVSLGAYHSAYIDNNDDLYMFGDNGYGLLGDGTTINKTTPVKIASNVKDVSLGDYHSAYIDNNDDLYMFGLNVYGQLGDGTTTNRATPFKLASNVKDVSLGMYHSAYIDNNGDLYMFGYNDYAQLGDGTTTTRTTPFKLANNVKDVSLGTHHSAYIDNNGDLYMFGDSADGKLGDGTPTDRTTPFKLISFEKKVITKLPVITLTAQFELSTVVVSFNSNGGSSVSAVTKQIGSTYGTLPTPTKSGYTFGGWYKEASLTNKVESSTVVTNIEAHTLYAKWVPLITTINFETNGGNAISPMILEGPTSEIAAHSLPTPIKTGYTFDGWYTNATLLKPFIGVTAGTTLTVYAKWTVNTYTVSFNSNGGSAVANKTVTYDSAYGDLPTPTRRGFTFNGWYKDSSLTNKVEDTTVVSDAEAHTLYAKWTRNNNVFVDANIEHGTVTSDTNVIEPGEKVNITVTPDNGYRLTSGSLQLLNENGEVIRVLDDNATSFEFPSDARKVVLGASNSAYIDNNGDLYMFGQNNLGQLGDGTTTDKTIPFKLASNVKDVVLGYYHSAYIDNNGDLYMFGYNIYGQLGDGTTTKKTTPVKIASNIKDVALGAFHSSYIDNNGDLYMFGQNDYGQLGDGTTTNKTTPVKIASNVKDVALGGSHSAYIDNNGDLYMFGSNTDGQLGDGTTTDKITPVKIASNVKDISLGYYHSVYIDNNGDLYMFGYNGHSQLGDDTTTKKTTPFKLASNVKDVVLGYYHSAYIDNNGDLYMFGQNKYGQLGDGTTTNKRTPVKIASNIKDVALGYSHSAYIDSNGDLYMFGQNDYGQLGDGTTTNKTTPFKLTSLGNTLLSVTITAQFEPATVVVSFNSNGGSAVSNKTVTYDSTYGTLTAPTRTGYTFEGWYKEAELTNKVDASTVVNTASNHTLYAKWTANTYTVSFNSNGGSPVDNKTVTYDAT